MSRRPILLTVERERWGGGGAKSIQIHLMVKKIISTVHTSSVAEQASMQTQTKFLGTVEELARHDYTVDDIYNTVIIKQYLTFQTLNNISAEKNSTIIFPLPIDLLKHLCRD
jgi:hypothetical protein